MKMELPVRSPLIAVLVSHVDIEQLVNVVGRHHALTPGPASDEPSSPCFTSSMISVRY